MEVRIIIYSVLKGYDEEHKKYGKRGEDKTRVFRWSRVTS
jgi:hypothetical protein